MFHRTLACLALMPVCVAGTPGTAWAEVSPLRVGGDPRVHPVDFRSTVFATGLNFPYGMERLPDGSLLVGTSRPDAVNGNYFRSTGELVRLVDANNDGVADQAPEVVFSGLPGAVTALARAGPLLFVTSAKGGSERISILRGDGPSPGYTLAGSLDFAFPAGWWHTTYAVAAHAAGSAYKLLFNVGSSDNASQVAATVGLTAAGITGFVPAQLEGASLYELTLSDTGGSLQATDLRQVASGLRNAAGIALRADGRVYFADNGIDGLIDGDEPLSADELNLLSGFDLASPAVEFFGFPDNYVEYRTGTVVGGEGRPPLAVFQPLGDALSESEGPAQIALAPAGFPVGLNNGVFIGFHGKGAGGLANEENPVVYLDLANGGYFHFVGNDEPAVGHLDGLLSTADSLFLADMSYTG
jgi:glucose/arabinose dehydrogenase